MSTLQAYAYDWLLSISEESEILSKRGLSWSIALYFSSRCVVHFASCDLIGSCQASVLANFFTKFSLLCIPVGFSFLEANKHRAQSLRTSGILQELQFPQVVFHCALNAQRHINSFDFIPVSPPGPSSVSGIKIHYGCIWQPLALHYGPSYTFKCRYTSRSASLQLRLRSITDTTSIQAIHRAVNTAQLYPSHISPCRASHHL